MNDLGHHIPLADLELKAEAVINLGEQMSDLLESEDALLTRRNGDSYGQFVQKKQKLLLDYQGAVKSLMLDKDLFGDINPTVRAQLKATGSRLDALASQNAEKLSVTAAATHKVLQVIIDSVRREVKSQTPGGYHPSQFTGYRDDRTPMTPPAFVAEKA